MSASRFLISIIAPTLLALLVAVACSAASANQAQIQSVRFTPTTDSFVLEATLVNNAVVPVAGRVRITIAQPKGNKVYDEWLPSTYSLAPSEKTVVRAEGNNLQVEPWWPEKPTLYDVTVSFHTVDGFADEYVVRTGFRTFSARDGRFYLNGLPYFIRGAQYTPMFSNGSDPELVEQLQKQPDFPRSLVEYLDAAHINMTKTPYQDLCDEFGIMNFGNGQGGYAMTPHYNNPLTGSALEALRKTIEQNVAVYYNHPSFVMPVFWNEADAKNSGISAFLAQVRQIMRTLDPTRPVVANLGFGRGANADVDSAHWYWGYHTAGTELFRVRDAGVMSELQRKGSLDLPFILTETGGNYTDERGEFPYSRTGQFPIPDLIWIGRSHQVREDSLEYQAITVKEMAEGFRRARSPKNRISGVIMFTSPFFFDGKQITPKPAYDELRLAMQPVLVSTDTWKWHYYSGDVLRTGVHIVHDDVLCPTLAPGQVRMRFVDGDGTTLASTTISTPEIDYYTNWQGEITLQTPILSTPTRLQLHLEYVVNGETLSENQETVLVAPRPWAMADQTANLRPVALYDPTGSIKDLLSQHGVRYTPLVSLDNLNPAEHAALIIGVNAIPVTELARCREHIRTYAAQGGRALAFRQNYNAGLLLPVSIETSVANGHSFMGVDRIEHPLFSGLEQSDFRFWADVNGSDLYTAGPGFRLRDVTDLRRVVIWGTMGAMQRDIVVAEYINGSGSIIVDNSNAILKSGTDPLAGRFLVNMINYLRAQHPAGLPEITRPVRFGEFSTEKGIISCEELQGWRVQPNRKGRVLTGAVKVSIDGSNVPAGHLFFQLPEKPAYLDFQIMHPSLKSGKVGVYVNGGLVMQSMLRLGENNIRVDVRQLQIDPQAVQVTLALTHSESAVLGFTPVMGSLK